jgi:hypothetical protein
VGTIDSNAHCRVTIQVHAGMQSGSSVCFIHVCRKGVKKKKKRRVENKKGHICVCVHMYIYMCIHTDKKK